ncbi:hypothetical protein K466DRAFT_373682 [Polyporus arcularius HHB13444]|uniref:Uncharacterized protein n=1 Tax=Polyporus arcularius HHB13444 TaxID=1314778 RepID=A0A5C3NT99_9APHY|nr:hypothetical protein K466DRAFT_373682 [Polyporus arcularius HHB13444]
MHRRPVPSLPSLRVACPVAMTIHVRMKDTHSEPPLADHQRGFADWGWGLGKGGHSRSAAPKRMARTSLCARYVGRRRMAARRIMAARRAVILCAIRVVAAHKRGEGGQHGPDELLKLVSPLGVMLLGYGGEAEGRARRNSPRGANHDASHGSPSSVLPPFALHDRGDGQRTSHRKCLLSTSIRSILIRSQCNSIKRCVQ